jgi:hypothetical protein
MNEPSLQAVLTSGSSRVLNCAAVYERLRAAESTGQALFRTRVLNASVLIKDTPGADVRLTGVPADRNRRRRVGTKIYLPYDSRNIYAGGLTVFYGTRDFEAALANILDLRTNETRDAFTLDCYVLDLIDNVPSVSPFLLRDKFLQRRVASSPLYFDVPAEEWAEIDQFVRSKLLLIARSVYGGADSSSREQVDRLLQLLWDLTDREELRQLGRIFRIPDEEILDTFFAWKGVIFYEYEHSRRKEAIYGLLRWLEHQKNALDPRQKRDAAVQVLIVNLAQRISKVLVAIEGKLTHYQEAFNELFLKRADYDPFFEFLSGAQTYFQSIGIGLARLDHLTEIWERGTGGRRAISPNDRNELLRILLDHAPEATVADD